MSLHRAEENRQSAGRSWCARGWNHYRVTDEFLRLKRLDPGFKLRLIMLERLYTSQPTCVASNEEFREILECSKNTLQVFFREGERGGWFKRVKIISPSGICTGRLGLIALKRATDQAVVRPDEIESTEARLRRKEGRRNGLLPYRARDPTIGERATQSLGSALPNDWVAPAFPQGTRAAEDLEDPGKPTTTASGNFSAPAREAPAAPKSSSSNQPAQTARPQTSDTTLAALVERADALLGPNHRRRVELLAEECKPEVIAYALELGEKRNRKPGNVPVKWPWVRKTARNVRDEDSLPAPRPVKPPPGPAITKPADPPTDNTIELQAKWDQLTDAERESIRADVRTKNPGCDRWPQLFAPLCLAALEQRR